MERVWTSELAAHSGERVELRGWLHRMRQLSSVSFLLVRDAQGIAQVVIEDASLVAELAGLHNESVLLVRGDTVIAPSAPGGVELHNPTVEVVSAAAEPPPFDLFRPTLKAQLPTILDHAALAYRHPRQRALFRMSSVSMESFRATLRAQHYVEIQTPKIVGGATESGANVFGIDYFGERAFLAQSPQLYKQIMVGVFERVFEVGPVFRAEPHDTPRHLNEYVSLDVEMGFIDDHTTVMATLRRVLAGMVAGLAEHAAPELALLKCVLPEVPDEIPVIHFSEAQERISRATGEDLTNEPDLAPAHERWLGTWAEETFGSPFLFVVGYPMVKRPFYTHPDPARPAFSNSFDLLFRGLELVTGGQRLHRYKEYLGAMTARGIEPAEFAGYLDAFRYGMPPHGGFAIGLERWLARLAERPNVRETTLFPRDTHRLTP
jgi:nondiscriminating aspartyl-tRNA synthetase